MIELTNSIAAPKRGRPVFTHDNRFVRQWLYRYSSTPMLEDELLIPFKVPSIYELPSWCHDVIVGAARLNNSEKYTGKPLNTTLIIKLLMAFPTLTNANVKAYLEPRMAGSVSKQYVSQLTNAAISASKSIDYYLDKLELGEQIGRGSTGNSLTLFSNPSDLSSVWSECQAA
ncbi:MULTISPECIES: hypothetical protein [Aeromonas]|jgi:hypothetical protein|uniref:hypothetical protein n=1 Tax=Aeromonas TaxID=642 RepID=UPI000F946FBC